MRANHASYERYQTGGSDPMYRFNSNGECTIRVVNRAEDLEKAWNLVYRQYLQKGYSSNKACNLWYGIHDLLPNAMTFLAEKNGIAIGTVTLIPESPMGLPANNLFPDELANYRRPDRNTCEAISLACIDSNARENSKVVKQLFRVVLLTAIKVFFATDVIITANPSHCAFHKKKLLMSIIGSEKLYDKVSSAPAVLLGLNCIEAQNLYLERYHDKPGSFYRFMFSELDENTDLQKLFQLKRRNFLESDFQKFFVENSSMFEQLPAQALQYICFIYPTIDKLIKKKHSTGK